MLKSLRPLLTLFILFAFCAQLVAITSVQAAPPKVVVTFKTLTFNNGTAKYPVVSGLADKERQDKINRFMLKEARAFMEGAKEAKYASWDAAIAYNKNGLVSFTAFYDTYFEGAAHGLPGLKGYTFDTASGKQLQLRDLYDVDGEGKVFINQEIRRLVTENDVMLFEPFENISANPEYYLIPEYVVIVYQPYEIAPYAAGILEFPIPAKSH
mgnify:CR=1 FL=1